MNEVVTVKTLVTSVNENGFPIQTETDTELFCEVRSASYVDSYGSEKHDVRASIEFVMRKEDFDSCRKTINGKHYYPSVVIYDGASYELVRWRYIDGMKASMVCG